ncbi:MAG: ABC transporter permease subunit [Pseudomonadota bacterium]
MWQHAIVAWRSGLRSRSFHALVVLGLLAIGAAYLSAQFSGRQPNTVALDVAISGVRFIALLMVVFWCQELVAREVERKTVFFALAYPVPRSSYLLGRYLGVLALAASAIAILGGLMTLMVSVSGGDFIQASPVHVGLGLWATMLYIFIDVAVVGAFTVFIATISATPLLPLALGVAFAVAARGLSTALQYLRDKDSGAADLNHTLGPVVTAIQWLIPDLGRLDIRSAALYGQWPSMETLSSSATASALYIVIAMAASILVFRGRQFS